MCMSVHFVYARCLGRLEEGIGSPGADVTDSYEPLRWF